MARLLILGVTTKRVSINRKIGGKGWRTVSSSFVDSTCDNKTSQYHQERWGGGDDVPLVLVLVLHGSSFRLQAVSLSFRLRVSPFRGWIRIISWQWC